MTSVCFREKLRCSCNSVYRYESTVWYGSGSCGQMVIRPSHIKEMGGTRAFILKCKDQQRPQTGGGKVSQVQSLLLNILHIHLGRKSPRMLGTEQIEKWQPQGKAPQTAGWQEVRHHPSKFKVLKRGSKRGRTNWTLSHRIDDKAVSGSSALKWPERCLSSMSDGGCEHRSGLSKRRGWRRRKYLEEAGDPIPHYRKTSSFWDAERAFLFDSYNFLSEAFRCLEAKTTTSFSAAAAIQKYYLNLKTTSSPPHPDFFSFQLYTYCLLANNQHKKFCILCFCEWIAIC